MAIIIYLVTVLMERTTRDHTAQHPDAAASLREGLGEMFTVTDLGPAGQLARCLATTNMIGLPNSPVVGRVNGRVTSYGVVEIALRWTATGFLEAEKAFKKLRVMPT